MTIKPFAIQGADLTLGGVNLQAGTTGVVIPGVTQATNYFVEEINETGEQTNPLNLPIVIDNVTHAAKVENAGASVSAYATYSAQLDDEDYIEELDVDTAGTYVDSEVDRNADFDMWGYTGSDAEGYLTNWVTGDWVQIPFRPKMRAGAVENIGGGADLEDIQVTRDDGDGFTELELADKDFNIRTTRSNPGQDADIGIYAADDLWLVADGDEVSITAANEVTINTNNTNSPHEWIFNASGHVQFPDGSVQVTAYTGTGDDNIWIETFASDAPSADFVQGATSVEYDADGNVIALFSHYEPGPDSSYTSVAKLTPTGAVLWQVRFAANLYTDGWGLAYDTVDNIVYVAGRTSGTPLPYQFATLTKLNGLNGSIVWSKTYDFEADSTSAVVDVDNDGNPVMVGYAYNGTDTYIVTSKINKTDGSVLWSKNLDGQGDDQAYGMAIGPNNEIVTIGYASQLGATDAAGTLYSYPVSNPNWTLTAGVTGGSGATYTVSFTDGVPTFTNINDPVGSRTVDSILDTISGVSFGGTTPADDMIVKVGTLATNDYADRMIVVKYATDGTVAWQKAVQFDADYNCAGADADIDSAGNIYVCGQYTIDLNPGNMSAMSLTKFNSSGVKQWNRRVVGACETFATSVVVGDDNQLYLSGITQNANQSDYIWVVAKYNTDGVVTWQRLIDNTTTWTFGGSFWFGGGGGSNIAVKNGYVALAGTFGDPGTQPIAVVVQIDTDATPFSVGDWDIKGATFSGVLNASASDITVVNANKPVATVSPAVGTFASGEDLSNFLTVTRYSNSGNNDSLVNGTYSVSLSNTGTVTLPAGGTITEGVVTSNPTIQLTPASPTVASQKLVIKGGGLYDFTQNGININYNDNTATVGTTLTFYVYSTTYTGQTLYWWINPQGAGIGDTESGTVVLTGNSGMFSILVDSDDYEFTVRVSPEADNYDPANLGVESGLINADAPSFGEHHLHLTTGNLAETSIFLGTDDQNVRTTVNGGIEITTPNTTNNVWKYDTNGDLTLPADGDINTKNANGLVNQSIQTGDDALYLTNKTAPIFKQAFTDADWATATWNGTSLAITDCAGFVTYIDTITTAPILRINGNIWAETTSRQGDANSVTFDNLPINTATPVTVTQLDIYTRTQATVAVDGDSVYIYTVNEATWVFGNDSTTTLPGAVVNSTATVNTPLTQGIMTSFVSGPNTDAGWIDGNYNVTWQGGGSATIAILGQTLNTISNQVLGTALWSVSDIVGSFAVGGSVPIVLTVDSIDDRAPIDLTKTVNKLTDGNYTLADGVEGQIMYLVRQTGAIAANITVTVAHGRADGVAYTDHDHYPFDLGPGGTVDIDTLIFTDSAWQADGGSWN